MFISVLKNKLRQYDPFGINLLNGFKALFVLELMFIGNYIYSIPESIFYYFYMPLSIFVAEATGGTVKEKYLFLFASFVGGAISIFLFSVVSLYYTFFVFFVFFYSLGLYLFSIYKLKSMVFTAPLMLSMASYSLLYQQTGNGIYSALNHVLVIFVAAIIIFSGLILFPKKYYFWVWKKAFLSILHTINRHAVKLSDGVMIKHNTQPALVVMERYARMAAAKNKYFSIIKMTLLTFDLVMSISYRVTISKPVSKDEWDVFLRNLRALIFASKYNEIVCIHNGMHKNNEMEILYRIILSWNSLCLTK